jgi:nitroreductase
MAIDYSRERILTIDPVLLRAMIRERTHHSVSVQLHHALAHGRRPSPDLGLQLRALLAVWEERGLPTDYPDLAWTRTVLDSAERASRGEAVDLSAYAWQNLAPREVAAMQRVIKERRSVRVWTDQEVPDELVDQILEAGLWAPNGCNLNPLRFLVVRDKNGPGLCRGNDGPPGPVHIVVCQDLRVFDAHPGYVVNPDMRQRNIVLEAGAVMSTMLLMAHALGLGGVWLTPSDAMRQRLRERFALADHIAILAFIDVGYPAITPIPPARIALDEAVLARV